MILFVGNLFVYIDGIYTPKRVEKYLAKTKQSTIFDFLGLISKWRLLKKLVDSQKKFKKENSLL